MIHLLMSRQDKKFGIIADDLTGAMDSGAGLLGFGLNPFITFGESNPRDSFASIVTTDSRDMSPESAYKVVRRLAGKLSGLFVYKKIDSTLKGNIGQEILAVMDALKFEKAIVCPAFPDNGRAVVNGKLELGEGLRFEGEARIPALLEKQINLPADVIGLDEIGKGPENIFNLIKSSERKMIVADAVEQKHLKYIARAVSISEEPWLPCGSGGLARELPAAFGYGPVDEPVEIAANNNPVIAAAGSRNPVILKQIKSAENLMSAAVVSIDPDKFVNSEEGAASSRILGRKIYESLGSGKDIILTTALSPYSPALREASAKLLARVTARTTGKYVVAGIFLTGGDIARETCRALGATGIKILKELEPGVVFGEAITTKGNIKIITKAGGFGSENALVQSICFLKGDERWKQN
jgi:D-threonate/D-erythronate kinase